MSKIKINLFGEQQTILQDWLTTTKHSIDIVHAGSGKTHLASIALPIFASDPKYHHGRDIIYSAPTMSMISALIWEPLKKSCREHFNIPESSINNTNMTIKFPGNIFIRCKSAEQKENLRGLNAAIWIADEASLYSSESLYEILNRLRPKPGQPETTGRMIVISTPYGAGPLYDLYKTALTMPDQFIVRHFNYEQMRSGNREFIERQKMILSPMKFASDYMCSFETIEDQFWYTWNRVKYTKQLSDPGGNLVSAHDFNKRVMCAVVAKVTDPYTTKGKIEILKSYAIPDCSTEGVAQAIRADFPKRRIDSVIDMSGTALNRDTTSAFGVTDRTLLEKYGFTIVNSKKVNPLISDTDNICNAFVNRGGLIVDSADEKLLEALATYHFADGTRKQLVKYTDAKYSHIDGLSDAVRYLITHYFPIQHADTGIAEYVGMDQRYARLNRPGIEHMPESPLFKGGPTMEEILGGVDEAPDYMVS